MKRLSLLLSTVVLLSACASETPSQSQSHPTTTATSKHHEEEDESDKPPFVGMTKAQALARYGEPKRQTTSDQGEQWIYIRGLGTAMAKAAIPFYFGGRDIKTGVLTFGPDGKVVRYQWDTKTDN